MKASENGTHYPELLRFDVFDKSETPNLPQITWIKKAIRYSLFAIGCSCVNTRAHKYESL